MGCGVDTAPSETGCPGTAMILAPGRPASTPSLRMPRCEKHHDAVAGVWKRVGFVPAHAPVEPHGVGGASCSQQPGPALWRGPGDQVKQSPAQSTPACGGHDGEFVDL